MSVQATTSKVSYSGNGSASTAYPVPFVFESAADLVVLATDSAGASTTLVLNSGYTVTGAGSPSGGSVTTSAAYDSTNTITIYREVSATQLTSYAENDAFPAASHEKALDKLTFLCQQLARKIKLSFRLTEDSADFTPIRMGQAGYVLQSNGPGQAPSFEQPATVSMQNGSVTPAKLSTGGPSWDTLGNLSATQFSGPLNGNANSATALQTSRAIGLSGVLSGSASFNGSADATLSASFVQSPSFRNRIINGAMRIDQRNNGAAFSAPASALTYGLDRFYISSMGAAITGQRVASNITAFPVALRLTGAAGNSAAVIGQRIESDNCSDLVGQSVTVSFTAAHSGSGSISVSLNAASALNNFFSNILIASQSVTLTSTLTRYSLTFANLPASVANALSVEFSASSGLGSGVTLTITGIQLEAGSVATPFELRGFGHELALCQRYYLPFPATHALGATGGNVQFFGCLPVPMRTNPTINSPYGTPMGVGYNTYTVSVPPNGTAGAASLSAEL